MGRAVEVDVDRLHVRLPPLPRALAGHRDEEVEQPVGSVAGAVDEQEPSGGGPVQRALADPRREGRREARVDRVPAVGQDLRPGLGGEPVSCCNRPSHRDQA
jgi:hypothetical protein